MKNPRYPNPNPNPKAIRFSRQSRHMLQQIKMASKVGTQSVVELLSSTKELGSVLAGLGEHHDFETVSWLQGELSKRRLDDLDVVESLYRNSLLPALAEDIKKTILPKALSGASGEGCDDWAEASKKMDLLKNFMDNIEHLAKEGGLDLDDKKSFSLTLSSFRDSDLTFFEWCPIVNTMYDLLFDEAPTVEQIKDLLQTLILISGLVLGASAGLFGASGFGDFQDALKRHSDPTDISWSFCSKDSLVNYVEPSLERCTTVLNPDNSAPNNYASGKSTYGAGWALSLIDGYPFYAIVSLYSVALSCIFSVGTYLFITTTSFSLSSKSEGLVGEESVHLVQAWWLFVRWIIFTCFAMWILGTLATGWAYATLAYIKFPNMAIELSPYFFRKIGSTTTGVAASSNFGIAAFLFWMGLWTLFSLGLANKYRIKRILLKRHDIVRKRTAQSRKISISP